MTFFGVLLVILGLLLIAALVALGIQVWAELNYYEEFPFWLTIVSVAVLVIGYAVFGNGGLFVCLVFGLVAWGHREQMKEQDEIDNNDDWTNRDPKWRSDMPWEKWTRDSLKERIQK